jgi:hypothetical protein
MSAESQEAMRAVSVMRFVIFGAVGFGIGYAIGGFFNGGYIAIANAMFPPGSGAWPWWAALPPQLGWFIAGACGGAALGLALRSWKMVAALALAGSLAFGMSFFLFFVLAFLFGFPLGSVGMGVFGGLMLGLVFGDWQRIVLLGLAGMVGFGIGGGIAAALGMHVLGTNWEQPPLLLLAYVLALGMVGIIGGASLGAALGYLEKRRLAEGQTPRVR